MNSNKLNILFVVAKNRFRQDGKVPIFCRLTFIKKRKQFATGLFTTPKYWNKNSKLLNHQINKLNLLTLKLALLVKRLMRLFYTYKSIIRILTGLSNKFGTNLLDSPYHFNGTFYVTNEAHNTLTSGEIKEIYTFTQDLVKQHKGIDYLQVFYAVEHDCKLFFIDNLSKSMLQSNNYSKEDNYCTLMLASEY